MRDLPGLSLTPCPPEYAVVVAEGWDTVQEALALSPTLEFVDLLEMARKRAIEVQDDLEGVVPVELNGQPFRVHATGAKGGFRWRFENDDYVVMVGSPRRDWTISVRYLSAGLWEHGLLALREHCFRALAGYVTQTTLDCVRVSRADWAFDFYAPAFSAEFVPGTAGNVVCQGGVKIHEVGAYETWSSGAGRGETLTIGSKATLQVQLYDKSKEITDVSGKEWMVAIWREALGRDPWGFEPARDVYRLECRFASEFLKERNFRRPFEVVEALPLLLAEALVKRRLAVPDGDSNRSRWPMHPLWSEAYRRRGATYMAAIGRKVTGRRAALLEAAARQIAGAIRSATVLAENDYDPVSAKELVDDAMSRIERDPKHAKKVDRAFDRYTDVDDAR